MVAMRVKGVQINEVKDLKVFQQRAEPVYKFVEGKVGKDLYDKWVAAAKAAARP
jgi:TRAP-type C4-dicarboxylate transport system substrate-binding protein